MPWGRKPVCHPSGTSGTLAPHGDAAALALANFERPN